MRGRCPECGDDLIAVAGSIVCFDCGYSGPRITRGRMPEPEPETTPAPAPRTTEQRRVDELLAWVEREPGLTSAEIGERMRASPDWCRVRLNAAYCRRQVDRRQDGQRHRFYPAGNREAARKRGPRPQEEGKRR